MIMVNKVNILKKVDNSLIILTENGEYRLPLDVLVSYQIDFGCREILGSCEHQLTYKLTLVLPYESQLVFIINKDAADFIIQNF